MRPEHPVWVPVFIPAASPGIQVLVEWPKTSTRKWPKCLGPYMGDSDKALGSGLWPGLALAVVAIGALG